MFTIVNTTRVAVSLLVLRMITIKNTSDIRDIPAAHQYSVNNKYKTKKYGIVQG